MAFPNGASGETEFPRIPHYYTVNSGVNPEERNLVAETLALVPVRYALICDPQDAELVTRLNISKTVRLNNSEAAIALANEIFEIEGERSIVIQPQSEPLTAFYPEISC